MRLSGAILAGGVPAGIYTSLTPEQCRYIADHAAAPLPLSAAKMT